MPLIHRIAGIASPRDRLQAKLPGLELGPQRIALHHCTSGVGIRGQRQGNTRGRQHSIPCQDMVTVCLGAVDWRVSKRRQRRVNLSSGQHGGNKLCSRSSGGVQARTGQGGPGRRGWKNGRSLLIWRCWWSVGGASERWMFLVLVPWSPVQAKEREGERGRERTRERGSRPQGPSLHGFVQQAPNKSGSHGLLTHTSKAKTRLPRQPTWAHTHLPDG